MKIRVWIFDDSLKLDNFGPCDYCKKKKGGVLELLYPCELVCQVVLSGRFIATHLLHSEKAGKREIKFLILIFFYQLHREKIASVPQRIFGYP